MISRMPVRVIEIACKERALSIAIVCIFGGLRFPEVGVCALDRRQAAIECFDQNFETMAFAIDVIPCR